AADGARLTFFTLDEGAGAGSAAP
ncbi:MAG: hypothetical protein QOG96_2044, partial [Pseudonocardiales bacterium]|nr:hypothetical protein [Pseudonocardiales bacterium]MDT7695704.1 hypothetical protein [Pseudonocardiales bacterium]